MSCVRVAVADVRDDEVSALEAAAAAVSSARDISRVSRRIRPIDRLNTLLGAHLLRNCPRWFGCACVWSVQRPLGGGKPFLEAAARDGDPRRLRVDANLSHHGNTISVAARAMDEPGGTLPTTCIGIDVLDTAHVASWLRPTDSKLMAAFLNVLHPDEIARCRAASEVVPAAAAVAAGGGASSPVGAATATITTTASSSQRAAAVQFAIAWTRKEALGKAVGVGILHPLLRQLDLAAGIGAPFAHGEGDCDACSSEASSGSQVPRGDASLSAGSDAADASPAVEGPEGARQWHHLRQRAPASTACATPYATYHGAATAATLHLPSFALNPAAAAGDAVASGAPGADASADDTVTAGCAAPRAAGDDWCFVTVVLPPDGTGVVAAAAGCSAASVQCGDAASGSTASATATTTPGVEAASSACTASTAASGVVDRHAADRVDDAADAQWPVVLSVAVRLSSAEADARCDASTARRMCGVCGDGTVAALGSAVTAAPGGASTDANGSAGGCGWTPLSQLCPCLAPSLPICLHLLRAPAASWLT